MREPVGPRRSAWKRRKNDRSYRHVVLRALATRRHSNHARQCLPCILPPLHFTMALTRVIAAGFVKG